VNYEIVPSSIRHIRPMAKSMRREAAMALDGYGFNPRIGLRRAFLSSFRCRTALVDGKPVAMWGVAGTLLSDSAQVWLVLSPEAAKMPRAVVREARGALEAIRLDYRDLWTTILPNDPASVRFALALGFGGDDPEDDVLTDERYRVMFGDGYVLRLSYRGTLH
jgi:hypothetical protein